MGGLKETIAEKLPEGAKVGEIYSDPADDTKIIIEYILDKKLYRVSPDRIKVQTLMDYSKSIPLIPGLTYNDVYEIISNRHQLNLVKGIDYEDNTTEITELGRMRLPIYKYSLRFLPGALVADIIDPNTAITGNEESRDLTDVKLSLAETGLLKELINLSFQFFDCTAINCFEDGRVTIGFRQLIADKLDASLTDVKKEVLASYLLKGYSDELSDVALLVGPSQLPYFVRYESATGDVP